VDRIGKGGDNWKVLIEKMTAWPKQGEAAFFPFGCERV